MDIRWATRVLVGAAERREREGQAAAELLRGYDPQTIWDYWEWNKVRLLATHHARQAGLTTPLWDGLEADLAEYTRTRAIEQEMTAFKVTRILARDGIKAVTIKGPVMAKQLYGRVDLRDPSADVDILVAASNLHRAKELLEGHGWTSAGDPLLHGDFPDLHFAMWGPEGEHNVELHWRVQWYDEFEHTNGVLERAVATDGGVWAPSHGDQSSVLLLVWLRDGLHRLRLPADLAASSSAPERAPAQRLIRPLMLAHEVTELVISTRTPEAVGVRARSLARIGERDKHLAPRAAFTRVAWVDVVAAPSGAASERWSQMLFRHPEVLRHRYRTASRILPIGLLRAAGLARTIAGAPRSLL